MKIDIFSGGLKDENSMCWIQISVLLLKKPSLSRLYRPTCRLNRRPYRREMQAPAGKNIVNAPVYFNFFKGWY